MTARRTAVQSYREIESSSAVLAADAHELVRIVYDRIVKEVETMLASSERQAAVRFREAQTKAVELLHGLSSGVDPQSGSIAVHLQIAYRSMIHHVGTARCGDDPRVLSETLLSIQQLAEAWRMSTRAPMS